MLVGKPVVAHNEGFGCRQLHNCYERRSQHYHNSFLFCSLKGLGLVDTNTFEDVNKPPNIKNICTCSLSRQSLKTLHILAESMELLVMIRGSYRLMSMIKKGHAG